MNKLQFFALIDDRNENGVTLQTVSYVPKQLCWLNSLVGLFELFGFKELESVVMQNELFILKVLNTQ